MRDLNYPMPGACVKYVHGLAGIAGEDDEVTRVRREGTVSYEKVVLNEFDGRELLGLHFRVIDY